MTRKFAKAVIGAGYGDEGKGLMTDFHAAKGASVVVRSNGGAQAGHTVTTPEGRRHVFHHFGSGAFADVPTHLSRFFVMNPVVFFGELKALEENAGNIVVTGSPDALVTTPYDMMINQIIEMARGHARHGSCGLGIGETEERSLRSQYALLYRDVLNPRFSLQDRLRAIRDEWVGNRLKTLGVNSVPVDFQNAIKSDDVIDRFIADCELYRNAVQVLEDRNLPDAALFEGAQGLLLDQTYGAFPHVTRSNTGLRNMVEISSQAGYAELSVTYATRAYVTRHGAGPLAHADNDMSWLSMVDETNQPNAWQGTIRQAPLDVDVLKDAILFDLKYGQDLVVRSNIAVSCLDQIDGKAQIADTHGIQKVCVEDIPDFIEQATGQLVSFVSFGPTRATIVESAI